MGYATAVGSLLTQAVFGLLLFVPVLRVILPLTRVRFGNPICQLIYRLTNPVLTPLTRVLPSWRGLSLAAVILAWFVAAFAAWFMLTLFAQPPGLLAVALIGTGTLVHFTLSIYFWSIVIRALTSFFAPDYGNPAFEVLFAITEPVLKPFRRIPPHIDAISLSPLWACLAIRIMKVTLIYLGLPAFPL